MNVVRDLIEFLKQLVAWWFIVEPWEQAVRVRFGKYVRLFHAGVHWRIPFFDKLYVQNTRRRVLSLDNQTVTTRDGKVLTLNGSIGYRIEDVLRLHQTLHDANDSVKQELIGVIARYVATHDFSECTPAILMQIALDEVDLSRYGLVQEDFYVSGYVGNVPSFRIINDGIGGWVGGAALTTNEARLVGMQH